MVQRSTGFTRTQTVVNLYLNHLTIFAGRLLEAGMQNSVPPNLCPVALIAWGRRRVKQPP